MSWASRPWWQDAGTLDGDGLSRFLSREPTPDDAAEFADELDTTLRPAE